MDASRTVVAAPMSFAGSLGRMTNLLWHDRPVVVKVIAVAAVPIIVGLWWAAIVGWYFAFGLILAPYRLVRRGSRKRKREARMHQETLRAIRESQQPPSGGPAGGPGAGGPGAGAPGAGAPSARGRWAEAGER